jgi:type IV pilus assembly protein PilY1
MNTIAAVALSVFISFLYFLSAPAFGQTSGEEEFFSGSVKPNVLIILDNSNSMDEDFFGNAAGSWSTGSKAVEGKRVLNDLVTTYANAMRLGLMTYRLPPAIKGFIYNNPYFVSYDPRSYCPTPVEACVEYCRTGSVIARSACQTACTAENPAFEADYIDDSITGFPYGSGPRNKYCGLVYPKTNRLPNPTDPGRYFYYKQALPFYNATSIPDGFFYAETYNPNDDYRGDIHSLFAQKTGTSDGPPWGDGGYSLWQGGYEFTPTDSDIALGYNEFGLRVALLYVGRTWYAEGSPGNGFLHVPVNDNQTNNQHLENLLAKLQTHEGRADDYMSCTNTTDPNMCSYIVNAGLTPTAGTFQSAINYFQGSYPGYATPIQSQTAACQRNFIVYVTDGLPTVNESGLRGTADSLMPSVLGKIQSLRSLAVSVGGTIRTYDIRTYVVGLGLTSEAKAKVDAMAVAGGTDVEGRALYADNPEQLQEALDAVFSDIQSGTYSFSQPSVSAVRTADENFIYVSSFGPIAGEPFWQGALKKIAIQEDGSLGDMIWEAGSVLEGTAEGGRNIKTYLGGSLRNFARDLSPTYFNLALSETEERNQIVDYVRGKSTLWVGGVEVPNPDHPRKLGDIFHANPVTIGSPSRFFEDPLSYEAFQSFRESYKNRDKLVLVGANDGQVHAFETLNGTERWSFIPPNLLPKLKDLVHTSHPTTKKHKFFVDGPISAADVKLASGWTTLAVFGLGMGVRGGGDRRSDKPEYLWSDSPSCDRNFKDKYNPPHSYYCGYFALDVTETANFPRFKWIIRPQDAQAPYLGEPWSKMVMGRVKINGQEKWVGFIGGGYSLKSTEPKAGRGFFVVDLDPSEGREGEAEILWSFTKENNGAMGFIPGTPAIVDRDNDGFIDTAYVGDLSGNLWKFTFCPYNPNESACGISDWDGKILFSPGNSKLPTFNSPAVARDQNYHWVFWGTGNKAYPNEPGPQNRFLAIRDKNPTSPYTLSSLQDITNTPIFTETAKDGWYINLSGQERVLSDATVFGGIVFFTSYAPSTENMCGATGSAALYGMAMMPISIGGEIYDPGKGVFQTIEYFGRKGPSLGTGVASAPIISLKPPKSTERRPDFYVTVSGGAGTSAEVVHASSTFSEGLSSALAAAGPAASIIHWRDLRVQP